MSTCFKPLESRCLHLFVVGFFLGIYLYVSGINYLICIKKFRTAVILDFGLSRYASLSGDQNYTLTTHRSSILLKTWVNVCILLTLQLFSRLLQQILDATHTILYVWAEVYNHLLLVVYHFLTFPYKMLLFWLLAINVNTNMH
jgi:hypothetical protein